MRFEGYCLRFDEKFVLGLEGREYATKGIKEYNRQRLKRASRHFVLVKKETGRVCSLKEQNQLGRDCGLGYDPRHLLGI